MTLKSSDDLGINTAFGGTFDDDMFDRLLGSKFDKDADTTVFVVPFIKDKEGVKKSPRAKENSALAIAALCIGGMVVSRSMNDHTLGEQLREAATKVALELGGWKTS